ncbi:MAG: beta strand repeat-containing protein [Armatimonadota bacterium]
MLIQSRLKALLVCVFAALTHVASAQVVRKELSVPASSIDTRTWQPQVVQRHQGNVEPPENPVMPPVVTGKKHDLPIGKVDPSAASVTPGKKFAGISSTGWYPPDCDIAVGQNHIVEVVNSSIAFYTKSGTRELQQTFDTFFAGVAGGSFLFDPKAYYDRTNQRYVIVVLELDTATETSKVLVAVSDDANPNGTWHRYRFEAKLTVSGTSYWLDYPGFGYNQDGYVITGNMFGFSSGWAGVQFLTIPSAPLLTGSPANVYSLRDGGGASAQVAECVDASSAVYAIGAAGSNDHRLYALSNVGTSNPTLVSSTVAIPNYSGPTKRATSTGGQTLDAGDGRLYNAWWSNGRMLAAHAVQIGNNVGIRWYEFSTTGWPGTGNPSLVQSGNISSNNYDYFYPALAKDSSGAIGLVFGGSNASETANIFAAGRLTKDPLGNVGTPVNLGVSAGVGYTGGRWGDYFGTEVDPVDGRTFWAVAETLGSNNDWDTQIVSFSLSPVVATLTVAPTTLVSGLSATGTVTLSGPAPAGGQSVNLSTNNAAILVPASIVVPQGLTSASFNIATGYVPADVVVTVTANTSLRSTSATLTVKRTAIDAVNTQKSSVPGGQVVSASVSLTGNAGVGGLKVDLSVNDPAASVPASVTVASGQLFGAFNVSTFPVVDDRVVTIRASADGLVKTKQITVERPRLISVQFSPKSFAGGEQVTGTVQLTGIAPAGGISVALSSSDAAVTLPATVLVAAGQSSITFDVSVMPVTTDRDVLISAVHRGQTVSETFRLEKTVLKKLQFSSTESIGGETLALTVELNGPAPDTGMAVTLNSDHPAIAVPATIVIPAGERAVTLDIVVGAVSVDTTVHVTGVGNGGGATTEVLVNRPELTSFLLSPRTVTGGMEATGIVRLTGIAPSGGITVSISSDSPLAQVPAFIVVQEGLSEATFKVATTPVGTDIDAFVTAVNETESLKVKLTIKRPLMASAILAPNSVLGGMASRLDLSLTGPAPVGGLRIDITTDGSGTQVPATATVPAGSKTASVPVTTLATNRTRVDRIAAHVNATSAYDMLTVRAVVPSTVTMTPNPVTAGGKVTGTVTLRDPAPTGGLLVALSSDKSSATVPSTVLIPAGKTTGTFAVTTSAVTVDVQATIKATANAEFASTVLAIRVPAPQRITFNPTDMTGGGKGTATIDLTVPAPTGGLSVKLTSSISSLVLPATVSVPAGKSSVIVSMSAAVVSADVIAKVTASANGIAVVANIAVKTPRVKSVVAAPSSVLGGKPVTFTVMMTGVAPASGTVLTMTSSSGAIVVPASVKIPAGKSSVTVVGTTNPVTSATECTIGITAAGDRVDTIVVVRPTVVKSLVVAPVTVVGGAKATATITLTEPAPVGGVVVVLESTSPKVVVPESVVIPAGKTAGGFTVVTSQVSATDNVQVRASLGGSVITGNVSIVPVALASFTAAPTSVEAGGAIVITLKLATVSSVPVDVVMTTSDSALVPVQATITIPPGQLTHQQVVNVGLTAVKKAIILQAATQAVPKKLTVNVSP